MERGIMPTIASSHLPVPKSWEEFQAITTDAVRQRWPSREFHENGRAGQAQNGVDIFGEDEFGSVVGVQCKKRWNHPLSLAETNAAVACAETFQPALDAFFVATSCGRDAKLQEHIRLLSAERRKQGKFRVAVLFWEDITGDIARDPKLVGKHWPYLVVDGHDPHVARAEVHAIVRRLRKASTQLNAQVHHPLGVDGRLALVRFETASLRERIPTVSAVLPEHLCESLESLCDACDETNRAQDEISALGGPFIHQDDQAVREAVLRELLPRVAIQSGQILYALGDRQI
jgi:hypothetical protein